MPGAAVSTVAGLRVATWPSHQRLEKRLDIKSRFSTLQAYRSHLERMWGFCAAIEAQIGTESFGDALTDYESRRKLPLLTHDLIALGTEPTAIHRLARCDFLPACDDTATAFGSVYVIEGATLGGQTLLPMVRSRLGLTAERGALFLASYGAEVGTKWRSFGSALDAWCSVPERSARAQSAAVATFDALDRWLCG
jgi:heme oxygenase (biliverdin-IX-beta and delta-forming)